MNLFKENDIDPPEGCDWRTTMPNPYVMYYNMDKGQRGWTMHAVNLAGMASTTNPKGYSRTPALCGTIPGHGWGIDMFIEKKCKRCLRKMQAVPS